MNAVQVWYASLSWSMATLVLALAAVTIGLLIQGIFDLAAHFFDLPRDDDR
jgi:hypothetical protein